MNKFLFDNMFSSLKEAYMEKFYETIREAKLNETFHFKTQISKDFCTYKYLNKKEKIFINNKNLAHNDIGPAMQFPSGYNCWFWNGIKIE